ncbi:hypothetical protein [Paenibacillus protaetiae]|uniref:Uncharacterized protein n=1 Tax=Paenibacillus protaetiae TaxID=2509456 RepID=A0A4P6EVK1_9BACL|nr:hypothetical protein [Paenibacillus protaetiae]QAY67062.1 hypothetical protein ET464_12300 [Paenibacillus protaetiae]
MSEISLERSGLPTQSPRRKKNNRAFLLFVAIWAFLIGAGISGAVIYSNHMKQQLAQELEQQTASQIAGLQADYEQRIAKMDTDYKSQLADLQTKVDALNELLNFTKDNADTKTDNSNKLYTQLSEVKKQLDALQKNLDVLK